MSPTSTSRCDYWRPPASAALLASSASCPTSPQACERTSRSQGVARDFPSSGKSQATDPELIPGLSDRGVAPLREQTATFTVEPHRCIFSAKNFGPLPRSWRRGCGWLVFGHLSACARSCSFYLVPALVRTPTFPSDKRSAYLSGIDPITALRIYASLIELPLLPGRQVTTLGRCGDLRVDDRYVSSVHVRFEHIGGYLRAEDVSSGKNPLIFEHREVSECYLQPGDQFRIGDTVFYALNDEMRAARCRSPMPTSSCRRSRG